MTRLTLRRLSEDPENKVLLIEAGDDRENLDFVRIPIHWDITPRSPIDWSYLNPGEPKLFLSTGNLHQAAGKALGGTSTINTLMFIRGNHLDYDNWGANNPGWSYNDVLPFFKKLETSDRYFDTLFFLLNL